MCKKLTHISSLALILALLLMSSAHGYTIVVVSDCYVPGVEPDDNHEDDSLVAFLQGLGYTVDTDGMRQESPMGGSNYGEGGTSPWAAGNENKLAHLRGADLVIVTRRTNSGNFDGDRMGWNTLETPLLLMSGYLTRGGGYNRWHWTSGGSGNAGAAISDIVIEAGQEDHPFLAGLTGPVTAFDWSTAPTPGQCPNGVFLPNDTFVDGATLIGTYDGKPMLADIPKGTEFANGNVAGERRAFMGHWGYDLDGPYGFDSFITADYETLLTNIVSVLTTPKPAEWRSSLYPEDWIPGYKDAGGRFLHDFSYAGYHKGEAPVPINPPGLMVDVSQWPYGADKTGAIDATDAIQAAIDTVGIAGGGIVYLPAGTYRLKPPAGSNCALRIRYSGVVLRGDGPLETFLLNDETYMRSKSVILVGPASGGWHFPLAGTTVNITRDVDYPTHIIPVADATRFLPGDWVILRTDCTDEFIDEHGMTGLWNSGLKGITFYRRVTTIDPGSNSISVDIPTRYYLKIRDNARVYRIAPHLEEVGIEYLSVGMRENLTGGLGDSDYGTPGTAAYEVHYSHFIEFSHVANAWIQDVHTYRPPGNINNWHTLSNIILLSQSRNVTVRNCVVGRPQYEGGGGNGYGYTLRGSDCLLIDCTAFHTRHNYDFKSMWTSGNVIFRCDCRDGRMPSDFHMHLSPANLFDSMVVDGDYLEARYRPYGTILHGQTTTESVFWNTYGTERCSSRLIVSRQWKWGYVIGTSGPVSNVQRGTQDNTAPQDFLEGQGEGETLVPQSLYLDQLYRRRGKDLDFSGTVDFGDFSIFAGYWMNGCSSPDLCYGCDFDNTGEVDFGDLAEFINNWLVQK